MFDNLTTKFQKVFRHLKGHGKLTEENIQEALREVRLALLEADVHYKVAKDFVKTIAQRAVGQEVMGSLTPGQQVIKIVNEALTDLMGGTAVPLDLTGPPPQVIVLVGLQGSGKTTTAGKLAFHLSKNKRRPCLVPADVYRPAAIDQLTTLAGQLKMPVYPSSSDQKPEHIVRDAVSFARQHQCDTLIVDTAGRLHIDQELMDELKRIEAVVKPQEMLLVADAMTGQDAVRVASSFHEALHITGVVLTKLDGDARGGAALSIKAVTGCPIKFVGVGEKLDALEVFHPDRMSSRILGMGDVLTIIEKAQDAFDEREAEEMARKFKEDSFTLEDFRDQLRQVKKLGSLESILKMLPGMGIMKELKKMEVDEKALVRTEAIINSMTRQERQNAGIINASRKRRIARGSGTTVQEVNQLLRSYNDARRMMRQMMGGGKATKKGKKKKKKRVKAFFPF
ncbi:signal recognition particle subunit FFH/SRP54 (srp54) [Desulfacinum hydrothermale DSM 13146]|uniref:Signal recognition particle protein n=1 Tax=Desulfacinum hydrothermale DSM 13146 TaxID=1121390 RepID=A0A1W1XQP2_9BACT|nr:signal recognition particle protein [Desulfacinum hydrothermale]SMC25828.1 signal recognition particle subunit FFH/SRP54 (srp54) [Desulfacinum hydrothermale DSM 13146]